MERYYPNKPGVSFGMKHYGYAAEVSFIAPGEYKVQMVNKDNKPCYQSLKLYGTEQEAESKTESALRILVADMQRNNKTKGVPSFENEEELVFCDVVRDIFKVSVSKLSEPIYGKYKVSVVTNNKVYFICTASTLPQAKQYATSFISRVTKPVEMK